ncbi:MAG TPA: bifunctional nuclease family protein [Armatimonadota bacterium]|jgi:bifunctional DNase/RNase|nr:bifunctional nuclease family protein [Armatimonadota bacterium]HOQ30497.1 bifunctional nuclease family protein [Armatimonadota bacterium]HPO74458.1 bifunctional nuclease family protein [Armatimonadota bacterium]HPT96433.1 bifunctional nuclease family protein [Armatimonadota bacterium]
MPFIDDDPFEMEEPEEGKPERAEELEQRPDRGEVRPREVKVVGVFEYEAAHDYFVLLRDSHGRQLPIQIGPFEAHSIYMVLQGEQPPRPLTHDLFKTVIERLGAKIDSLTIDDLFHSTYYAKLALQVKDGILDIDTRPSDGIALALRAGAPIYVAESVLDEAEKHTEGEEEELE